MEKYAIKAAFLSNRPQTDSLRYKIRSHHDYARAYHNSTRFKEGKSVH
jgi:hypothetical protein